jgi:hypothetical protein
MGGGIRRLALLGSVLTLAGCAGLLPAQGPTAGPADADEPVVAVLGTALYIIN